MMTDKVRGQGFGRMVRIAGWGAAALVLLLPLLAMGVTDEVAWGPADFILAAALLGSVGAVAELAARRPGGPAYRGGVALWLAATLFLAWGNAAVGVIGAADDPANLVYYAVLAVAIVGAAAARLRPRGMARAMLATALAQLLAPLAARLGGATEAAMPESLALNAAFAALWLASAWLFHMASRPGSAVDR